MLAWLAGAMESYCGCCLSFDGTSTSSTFTSPFHYQLTCALSITAMCLTTKYTVAGLQLLDRDGRCSYYCAGNDVLASSSVTIAVEEGHGTDVRPWICGLLVTCCELLVLLPAETLRGVSAVHLR